jgi:hypothetical protein
MARLAPEQQALLADWLPGAEVLADHSWGLIGTTVLELIARDGRRFILKAGDAADHHLARELRAHREWLAPWRSIGRGPRLVRADAEAKLLVTDLLPGRLVEGTRDEHDPDTYRQAGELLALLHGQSSTQDETWEVGQQRKTLALLDRPHRIDPATVARLRVEIASWPTPSVTLVPTHGDWQPRNWLMHTGRLDPIDLGRADLRPPLTDLTRLAVQQFRGAPALEAAFLAGYGSDPREPAAWHRAMVREAVGTAVWAHQVGTAAFEEQGLRMVADALSGSHHHEDAPAGR